MAKIALEGNEISTCGELPKVGSKVSDFNLVTAELAEVALADYAGKKVIMNIFPSIDTGVCAASVRKFNEKAAASPEVVVLCISADLPFAQKRFCGAEGIENVVTLSSFRSSFGKDYGVEIADGPLVGLLSRAVIVVDGDGFVVYTEQVPEITQEPDYESALKAI
ncbi:MAG: thiol peroxidase [Kiritimatiellae bacterium]|jgi:thiol peroxidase|nr:thiol peroxidase [Kiritimatiellia bacterium]